MKSKLFEPFGIIGNCTKKKYATIEAAECSMGVINKQKGYNLTYPYFCKECHSWHLTSNRRGL